MLLVKLIEPPCTERYARWCERSGNLVKFPSYSIRVNKVIDAIGRLENLSNRTNYEYTQEQVEAMFSIMEKRLLEVKSRFAPKKEKEDTFSFGRKAE